MATIDTRQRLVEVAHRLFYENGFLSVGIDRILAEVGVTKTTFYNHFESKDELILEVLRQHDRWWRRELLEAVQRRGGADPRAQLEAIFDVLDEIMADETYRGCIFINVAIEFPHPHDPAHRLAAENKRAIEAIIRDLSVRARASDPEALAEEMSLLIEGALVTRHVTGNVNAASIARRLADCVLRQYLPVEEMERVGEAV